MDKRTFLAIDIQRSQSKRRATDPKDIWYESGGKGVESTSPVEAMELLIERLAKTTSHGEFLAKMSQL